VIGWTPGRWNRLVTQDALLQAALSLPAAERAPFVGRLLPSFEEDSETLDEAAWEAAWSAEAERRVADAEPDTFADADEVMTALRARLASRR
jgi:hypothetical protein